MKGWRFKAHGTGLRFLHEESETSFKVQCIKGHELLILCSMSGDLELVCYKCMKGITAERLKARCLKFGAIVSEGKK